MSVMWIAPDSTDKALFFKKITDATGIQFEAVDSSNTKITFPDGETTDFMWVTIDKFIEMYNNEEIVPTVDFGREEYEEALKLP